MRRPGPIGCTGCEPARARKFPDGSGRKGIGLPVTGFAHKPDDIDDLIKMVGGAPLVIKLLSGTQGIGVVLAETRKAAESVIEAFMGLKADILVQEFIKEAGGADIRCFVIGDKVNYRSAELFVRYRQ